jgi:hypothetical protein
VPDSCGLDDYCCRHSTSDGDDHPTDAAGEGTPHRAVMQRLDRDSIIET